MSRASTQLSVVPSSPDLILVLRDEHEKIAAETERIERIQFTYKDCTGAAERLRAGLLDDRIQALAARGEAII
jgi:hypothetical protein